jgi:hypothetical protein
MKEFIQYALNREVTSKIVLSRSNSPDTMPRKASQTPTLMSKSSTFAMIPQD